MGATTLFRPVVGMVRYGNGYATVGADGGAFVFSDLRFVGSLGANPPPSPIVPAIRAGDVRVSLGQSGSPAARLVGAGVQHLVEAHGLQSLGAQPVEDHRQRPHEHAPVGVGLPSSPSCKSRIVPGCAPCEDARG